MSWWKNNKEQKEKKQRQQEQMQMLQRIATLTRFAKAGLLFIDIPKKKVVISTVAGSVNLLSDGSGYVVPDEEQAEGGIYPNACIYSCEDLELIGDDELHITGNADKGINTKDDL